MGTPDAEVAIDEGQVRLLLRDQKPELAELPIQPFASGWDNVAFRVGAAVIARLPRREAAVPGARNEQQWLPQLAPRLSMPVPAPFFVGQPGRGVPWSWSLVPWLPGDTADLDPPAPHEAERFGDFLKELHRPAGPEAPRNPYRGVPLASRAATAAERFASIERKTDALTDEVKQAWATALDTPPAQEDRWLHGDLHPRNVLVEAGRLSGVIDWGDLCAGDVAVDLAAAWMLFEERDARRRLLDRYGATDDERRRARGSAAFFGAMLLDVGLVDDPRHEAIGRSILRRITEEG